MSNATNTDIMHAVEALRVDVQRLVDQHDDHERRITVLEPIRTQVDRLTEHVADIGGKVTVIHDLLSKSEDIVTKALRIAGRELSSEVTAMVRGELLGLRDDVRELRESVQARPCLVGECVVVREPPA